MKPAKARIVIDVKGGLVQGIYTDNPEIEVQAVVADFDTQGADEEELLSIPDQEVEPFTAGLHSPGAAPQYVSKVFELTEEQRRKWAAKAEGKRNG